MAETKNLCAQIPLELHAKVCGEREQREQTTSQYITELLYPAPAGHQQRGGPVRTP